VPIYLPCTFHLSLSNSIANYSKSAYASTLLIASNKGTILLCLLNLAQVLGQLALGYLSDKQSLAILIFTSTSISAIIVFTLWYLAPFFSTLVLFSLLCGFFAGSYVVLYSRFISLLTTDSNTSIWLYGVFAFERGLGIVLAGPISGALPYKLAYSTPLCGPCGINALSRGGTIQ
jgi:MFS family permease